MILEDLKSLVQMGQSIEVEELEIDFEGEGWKVHGRLGVLRINVKTEVASTESGDLEVRTGSGDVEKQGKRNRKERRAAAPRLETGE